MVDNPTLLDPPSEALRPLHPDFVGYEPHGIILFGNLLTEIPLALGTLDIVPTIEKLVFALVAPILGLPFHLKY